MKIAILGGAGATGAVIGAPLAQHGVAVTLLDCNADAVDAINRQGLQITPKAGATTVIPVRATCDPTTVGPVDLLVVLVKCYQTVVAVRQALPLIGPQTVVLSLQNGWGNADALASVVDPAQVLAGVTYHSATTVAPGQVRHTGQGETLLGEPAGGISPRVQQIVALFNHAGLLTVGSADIRTTIWEKLALNCAVLPTAALLRFQTHWLGEQAEARALMQALLQETIAVAQAQQIPLHFEERWAAILSLTQRAIGAKPSMLQDVEARRQTEIAVINGAVVAAGQRLGIATPHNQTVYWMVRALEATF
ncbi:MAG: 2-dehydropantoate 2-reductase [Caldilineaceae bacterium]|nr:2-dehydropantoate 2-reductase [Caldilineaceae bacterium]